MKAVVILSLGLAGLAPAAAEAPGGACGGVDPAASLLAVHEQARKAHLEGKAELIEASTADTMAMASGGNLNMTSKQGVGAFFRRYLGQVRYLEWSDIQPPLVTVSPDGQLGWMAVQVKARYVERAKPEAGEKSFKSSWIATYQRVGCEWKMTGISSDVVDM